MSVFYPSDARVPEVLRTDEFLVRPLRATDVTLDYDAQKIEERYIRLYEEMGLRFLYSLRPHQPFLDIASAYLIEPNIVRS